MDTLFSWNIIVTGDDFGLINILNYPCLDENWQSLRLKAHSEHVCKVKFAGDGDYIISIGGYDQTVFVWKWKGAGNEAFQNQEESKSPSPDWSRR